MMNLEELRDKCNELIAEEAANAKKPVYAEYDYGNKVHTRALSEPEDLQVMQVEETAYSDSQLKVADPEIYDESLDEAIILTT